MTRVQDAARRPSFFSAPRRPSASTLVQRVLSSPGSSLDADTRGDMEARLGHDLSRIRVHADAAAAESAGAVGARAWTVGAHVAFAEGRYEPRTREGRHLLAHELAHAVQQGQANAPAASPLAAT